ncbi:MAG: hypothetical protein V3V14_03230 [Saprospiraceae bacterium]
MNLQQAHILNAFTLILIGGIGYLSTSSKDAFFPIGMGIVLLPLTNGVTYQDKIVSTIATIIILIVFSSLVINPLNQAIHKGDSMVVLRVTIMCITNIIALIYMYMGFVNRKKRTKLKNKLDI